LLGLPHDSSIIPQKGLIQQGLETGKRDLCQQIGENQAVNP
jgi:hypothetical protein